MTKKIPFTKRAIERLPVPADGREYVYDAHQAGLCICVTASGAKTFYRYGRIDGRPERVKIGRFPDVTVENARKATRELAGDIVRGENPARIKRLGRSAPTLQDLFDHWLTHAKLHKKTWAEDERKWSKYFGSLKSRRLADLTSADVTKWHRQLGEKNGVYLANRARALLSAMFAKAKEIGYIGNNPCAGVKKFREESRERFLLPDEMRPFFEALNNESPLWRDFWLLCLFTGARRGNVAAMAWHDLDLARGVWYLAGQQMKNGLPVAIVLPPPAVNILEERKANRGGGEYVFPNDSATGYVVDPRKSWARVVKAAGVKNLRPHDLRRSLGSWQAIAGASLQVIGASLGHRDPKATAVYARLLDAPVRHSVGGAVAAMMEAGAALPPKK